MRLRHVLAHVPRGTKGLGLIQPSPCLSLRYIPYEPRGKFKSTGYFSLRHRVREHLSDFPNQRFGKHSATILASPLGSPVANAVGRVFLPGSPPEIAGPVVGFYTVPMGDFGFAFGGCPVERGANEPVDGFDAVVSQVDDQIAIVRQSQFLDVRAAPHPAAVADFVPGMVLDRAPDFGNAVFSHIALLKRFGQVPAWGATPLPVPHYTPAGRA